MVNIPPVPINYLLVIGEPSDVGIQHQGYFTNIDGSFDPKYSRGALQFHPLRYHHPEVTREVNIDKIYEDSGERWLHFTLKAFPYNHKEREKYRILSFCNYHLELSYNGKSSNLLISIEDTPIKIFEVTSKDLNEFDIGVTPDGIQVFVNQNLVLERDLDVEFDSDKITFSHSRRDMLWWSQIIVADRNTLGCKLSTIEFVKRVDENSSWSGSADDISRPEISDVNGIRIIDRGDILFKCRSIFTNEKNFIDSIFISARINTVKEEKDISFAYHNGITHTGESVMTRNKYLENSQLSFRVNPIENRRWWFSDLDDLTMGLTSK